MLDCCCRCNPLILLRRMAQASLPSRRGRDVPSSHKKPIWCDDRTKKKKKKKNPAKGRTGREHAKRVLNESEPQEARICKGLGIIVYYHE